MIQDGEGQKMSKSWATASTRWTSSRRHGADAMRFTLAAMTTQTQDLRMPVDLVDPHSGQAFPPEKITDSAGYVVAAPIQTSPKSPDKKLVSSYGVISGAAKPTADMPLAKNTSSKFDLGRNFANKIWNAARGSVRSSNLESATSCKSAHSEPPWTRQKWSLADRWIVSRFNRTVEEANDALRGLPLRRVRQGVLRLLLARPVRLVPGGDQAGHARPGPRRADGQRARVRARRRPAADAPGDPVHHRDDLVAAERGPPEPRPARAASSARRASLLVKAKWPTVGDFSQAAEHIFPKLQEIIGAIRQLRNDHNVKPSQTVTVSILAPGDSARSILGNRELIETLATCTLKEARGDLTPPKSAARVLAAGCEIYVEGLVDESAEKARVAKRCEELKKQIQAMKGRLANESYTAKAPPHLVQQTRDQLAAAEEEYAKLQA